MISSSMRSPWHEDHVPRDEQQDQQVLLGHFMERSTSAPPISEQSKLGFMNEGENFLFGSNNTNSNNNQGDSAVLFSASGRDSAPLADSWGAGGLEDNTGRSTAPLSNYPSTMLSDALLSSGLSQETPSLSHRSASVGYDLSNSSSNSNNYHTPRKTSFADEGTNMSRSQSAAPSFLQQSRGVGPPPGLTGRSDSMGGGNARSRQLREMESNNSMDHYGLSRQQAGLRRPASAGLIGEEHDPSSSVLASLGIESNNGRGGAVRPAPKTLMDLIKEDTPPPPRKSNNINEFVNYNTAAGLGLIRAQTAGPSFYDDRTGYGDRAMTGSPLSSHLDSLDRFERNDGFQQRPEPMRYQSEQMGGLTQQMDRMQVGPGGRQQQYAVPQPRVALEPQGTPGAQYVTVPVSQVQRGQVQVNQHQRQDAMYQEQGRPRPRSVYAPAHVPQNNHNMSQHQQPSRQFEGVQQQAYYASNQPGAPMGVDQGMMSNQTMTTAVLPNGQTVYLNMTPYGYAPAQFQNPSPTHAQHMVHPQHQQQVQGHDQYVSVMPTMQAGGQVAYWQQQGADGGSMGQPVVMNQSVPMSRGSVNPAPNQHMQGEGERNPKASGKSRRGGAGQTGGGGRRDDARGGGKHSVTSPILDEFRATKNREWTMLDIKGHVVEFCQDQNGSRFIQQRLEIGNASEQQVVMAEGLPAVRQLRNDVFGNYVVQKLLEFGTPQMKSQLRDTLKGEILPLSLQMYGCRVVQKALEMLDEDDLPKLLIEFHHNVLSCIHDQNGNHVIQKCIEVMSTKAKQAYSVHDGERAKFFGEQIDFIINDVLDNVTPLSCHPYGCRVLQRILEHCVEPKKILALDEIHKCHRTLLDDQYGNYVIQHVLQYGRHEDRESIMHIVIANGLLQLSKQKFASNVVEKLLKYGTPSQRNLLVKEMLVVVDDPNTGGSSVVLLMVRDAYANYVVQTTLDVVPEGEVKRLLLEELNAHSTQLRQYTFAKHIVAKLSS